MLSSNILACSGTLSDFGGASSRIGYVRSYNPHLTAVLPFCHTNNTIPLFFSPVSWALTITSYLASVRMPRMRTSRRHTKKWCVLLFLLISQFSSNVSEPQALKWHPDRNSGSEEASQKFKQVRYFHFSHFIPLPRIFNLTFIVSDIRGFRSPQ